MRIRAPSGNFVIALNGISHLLDLAYGRGCDDILGGAFGFHLRASEAGVIAPDVEFDGGGHGRSGFLLGEEFYVGEVFEVVVLSP